LLTRRDRAVVGGLLLALVALAGAIAWPTVAPAGAVVASPTPTLAPTRPYREGVLGRPTAISPFGARSPADRDLVSLVFSGLVRLGPGETIVPDLAARWTVDSDEKTWTFTLRSDAAWQDGVPVTADDVAFTIRSLNDATYTGPGAGSWSDVTVEVVDERTVRFEIANPIAGFLVLATQPIAPAHLLDGVPPDSLAANPFGQQPIGSGPYRLVSWNADEATLEAAIPVSGTDAGGDQPPDSLASPTPTPTPVRPLPYLDRLEFRYFQDPADLEAAYRAGELDAASGLGPSDAASIGTTAGSHLLRYPGSTLTAVLFDQRADRTAFRDPRTRRALVEAIDRDAIVATTLDGLAVRADAPIPPSSWAFDSSKSPPIAHDVKAAAADLTAAGWKRRSDGRWAAPGTTSAYHLELVTTDSASNPVDWAVAAAIAADWRALGLDVDVVGLSPSELIDKRLAPGDFDVALVDVVVGLDPDLYPLLASSQTLAGGPNVSGVQDPTLDTKLTAARAPGDETARTTAYADLQSYLSTKTFLGPIAWRETVVAAHDDLVGPTVRRLGQPSDRFYDVLTWRLAGGR